MTDESPPVPTLDPFVPDPRESRPVLPAAAAAPDPAAAVPAPAAVPPAAVRARRGSPWLVAGIVLVAAASATGWYLAAGYGFHVLREEAIANAAPAIEAADRASDALRREAASAHGESAAADELADSVIAGLADGDPLDRLTAGTDAAEELAADADFALPDPIDYDESSLRPFWVSFAETLETAELRKTLAVESARMSDDADELDEARREVEQARTALLDSAVAAADDRLGALPFATNAAKSELDDAEAQIDFAKSSAPASRDAYIALAEALAGVEASHTAETERRAAPEYAIRGPVEDFARSIAHDVPLDFVWSDVVNGRSSGEWYSGLTSFWPGQGRWANVELTYSVADAWSYDINAKALVAHEVGHAQGSRPECAALVDGAAFGGDHEKWATAWAIAMGYDVPGSGIDPYGRPSDAQIDEARKCV